MAKTDIENNDNTFSKLAKEKNVPMLLSTSELAFCLHKSVRWIHMERSARRLPPSLKLGRSRFWIAEDIETWLKSKREGR
ncbi:helix-turn-helix transcriptional regulator [Planctomycetota bacterium]